MDKNVAALLREDTRTVQVRFFKDNFDQQPRDLGKMTILGDDLNLTQKTYTYVTDLDFKIGDLAVVFVGAIPKVVKVAKVNDTVAITPNDSIEYKWIVSKVDLAHYEENKQKNAEVINLVSSAYKRNLRSQFANVLLASMEEGARTNLLSILGGNKGETK